MKRVIAAAIVGSLMSAPALAVHGISEDGASMMTAYQDPYATPVGNPTGVRYGVVNFRYSSIGQVNDGYVEYYATMYPSNQYDGPFKIRFITPTGENGDIGDGEACPYLSWDIDNLMGDNDDGSLSTEQLRQYQQENCDIRPDPHLFASGATMGIELLMDSVDGGWFLAYWSQVAPMDGGQYNVTIFWSTGEANVGPPYAKILVTKNGGPAATIADPDYIDASYYYVAPNDGFDVQFEGLFWQGGCDTTDTSYVSTCFTGLTAEFWLYPANDIGLPDISPINSVMAFFLSGDNNGAPFLGTYGQMLMGFPPEVYNTGDDTSFIINTADVGFGLTTPQTSISQAWEQDGSNNPNFIFLGAGIQAAGQNF